MFSGSKFNKDISKWDVSNVTNMDEMFANSEFNQNISNWNTYKVKHSDNVFYKCKLDDKFEMQPSF